MRKENGKTSMNKKNQAMFSLSIAMTVILAVVSGLFFALGARAEGIKKMAEREVGGVMQNFVGITLNSGVTAEQVDTALSAVDNKYGGHIAQNSRYFSQISGDTMKKPLDTYALILNDTLTNFEDYLLTNDMVTVADGNYPAYCVGWEWSDDSIGESYSISIPTASGGTTDINITMVGRIQPSALSTPVLAGEPYVYSYRSLVAIKGLDIKRINSIAERSLYVNTSLSLSALTDVLSDNNLGRFYTDTQSMVVNSEDLQMPSAIYKAFLYFLAIVAFLALITFAAGKYRAYHYLGYGIISAIVLVIAYFTRVTASYGYYAYQNTAIAWFAGLLATCLVLPIVASIIAIVINNKKNQLTEGKGSVDNDNT